MRYEMTGRIDYVSNAGFAYPDLGHHVPHELQVDLHRSHPAVLAALGASDGHVRLCLFAEIDGAEVGSVLACLDESSIPHVVAAARNAVYFQARDPQLLAAGAVDP